MTRNKKPVVIVAIVLAALIIIPLLLLIITRLGGSGAGEIGGAAPANVNNGIEVANFDLRQLAEKANKLVDQDLAKALRNGDVSLDFMAVIKRDAEKAQEAMQRGKLDRAAEYYNQVVNAAEAQLAALALVDRARALNESSYTELQRLQYLKAGFENTYNEAVETYNSGLSALNAGDYETSVDAFEMTGAILGDLEARSIQQTADLLDAAGQALEAYQLSAARSAYESVLKLDASNAAATEGLVMVAALEGIAEEVKAIRALEASGDYAGALAALELLAAENPQNPFIRNQRISLEKRIIERDFQKLVATSTTEENAGNFGAAVTALEAALALKPDAAQQARLAQLKDKYKAARLERLLADGFNALKAGRYESARDLYKEAVALAPDSKEARTGLEKASSLYLANIRYSQNIAAADKFIREGRYPLAANLFNDAMASRPTTIGSTQKAAEERIREILKTQSKEVTLTIDSDKRTYVSIIGVLPPDRFRDKELKLFPDVYKVRGTRSGYKDVEIDLKLDATQPNPTIVVECTEKI